MTRKFRPGYDFRSTDFLERDRHHSRATIPDTAETGDPCECGNRCAERDYQGNAKRGPRAFCDTDERRIADTIRSLPETYASLRLRLPRSGQAGERVSGSREAPVPVDLQVEAFMREMVHVAVSWEEQVRAVARLADYPDGPRRDAVALDGACKTLHAHLNTLLSLPAEVKTRHVPREKVPDAVTEGLEVSWDTAGEAWAYKPLGGTDAGLEFLDLHRRAGGLLGLGRQRRRVTEVPCDSCDARTLVQYEAKAGGWEPAVRCTACPNSYIGTQYELLMGRVYSAQVKALRNAS